MASYLPGCWQYPDITCCRIEMGEEVFTSENYTESEWTQSSPIFVHGKPFGRLTIGYTQEKKESEEGPFMQDEKYLFAVIAERLGRLSERKMAEDSLKKAFDDLTRSTT